MIIQINNDFVEIPDIEPGHVCTEADAAMLNQYFADEASKLVQSEPTIQAAFAKLLQLKFSDLPIPVVPDPVGVEAIKIAKEIIQTRLLSEGLPLVNLEIHAKELVRRKPKLRVEALARLKARAITRANIFSELEIKK